MSCSKPHGCLIGRLFVDTATFGSDSPQTETVRSSNDRSCVRIARIVTHQIVIIS